MPVVDEMMDDVESGKTWTLSHVPDTINRLMRGLNEIACLVPDSFYEVSFAFHFSASFSIVFLKDAFNNSQLSLGKQAFVTFKTRKVE